MNYALLFALGELFALMLSLLFLYWLRRVIGALSLYLLFGAFFIFSQLSVLPSLVTYLKIDNTPGALSHGFLFLPVILMFLVIYEVEGTLQAQRIILGLIVEIVGFLYLMQLIFGQFGMTAEREMSEMVRLLLDSSKFMSPFLILSFFHAALLLLSPVLYQFLRNRGLPLCICLMLTTAVGMTISAFFQLWREPAMPFWNLSPWRWSTWFVTVFMVCGMVHFYLWLAGRTAGTPRSSWGIFSTVILHLQSAAQMRQRVEEWAERYQAVFDNATEMIFLLRKNGHVLNANRAALRIIGKQVTSRDFSITRFLFKDEKTLFDWDNAWQEIWSMQNEEEKVPFFRNNILLILDEEHLLNINLTLSAARLNDEELGVLILRDVTKQRQAELENRRLEEQLMHSQRLEALGVLAGGIAHDFNNLLQGIQASAEQLGGVPLDNSSRSMVKNILNAGERGAALTSQLLGFARKGKYQPKVLPLDVVVRKAADLFNIGHRDCTLRVLMPPDSLYVNGDETQLQQVVLNLLLNAKDALKPGSMEERKITLRVEQATEDMPQWKDVPQNPAPKAEQYLAIRVKDNGKGMSPEVAKHIFEPFYTTKGTQGTGLGLSMAYGCIANHHGWFSVDSEVDVGTEVTIFLPKA